MYQFNSEMLRQAQHDKDCYISTLVYCYIIILLLFVVSLQKQLLLLLPMNFLFALFS